MMMHRMTNLFEVPVIGADSKDQYSQRYISEIIGVRLEELFRSHP